MFRLYQLTQVNRNQLSQLIGRRLLSIKTISTPNENALKFQVDKSLLNSGNKSSIQFSKSSNNYNSSPLAKEIFDNVNDVESLMIGSNFITVNKNEFSHWNQVSPVVQSILQKFLLEHDNKPVVNEDHSANMQSGSDHDRIHELKSKNRSMLSEEDQEISDMCEELIETRIRPAIQDDGGDIVFLRYENGKVYVQLQGACTSCSLSDDTLKSGIQSMLAHYIDGIDEVVNLAELEFHKFEEKLKQSKHSEGHA